MALVQRFGFDYEETFASIAQMTFVCTLIAVASINPRNLSQMDVKNAFINEDVNEEVYISLPPGVFHNLGEVFRLHKALYDLKHAPQA
jgi:hypothetical protein